MEKQYITVHFKNFCKYLQNDIDWVNFIQKILLFSLIFPITYIISNIFSTSKWFEWLLIEDNNWLYFFFIIFYLLLFIYVLVLLWKYKYHMSYWEYYISTSITFLYVHLRICNENKDWDFIPFDSTFRYLDFLFFIISFILIYQFFIGSRRKYLINIQKAKPSDTKLYMEDIPSKRDKDDLKFINLFKKLNEVLYIQNFQKAFSVGIIGPWGIGKSTFIDLIEKEIKSSKAFKKRKLVYLSFTPSLSHSEDHIINEFFIQLSNELKNRNGRLSHLFLNYSSRLTNMIKDKSVLSWFKSSTITSNAKSSNQLYYEIEKVIKSLNLRIIVSIDDLDRLNGKEVLQILKLIKNTSNFPNFVFLIGLDKNYVIDALKDEKKYMDGKYIDKFFQLEIHIYETPESILREYLSDEIKKALIKINVTNVTIFDHLHSEIINALYFSHFISHFRDAKNLCNQLILDYQLVNPSLDNPEIDVIDLFKLTILKKCSPKLFAYLKSNKITEFTDHQQFNIVLLTESLEKENDFFQEESSFDLEDLHHFNLINEKGNVFLSNLPIEKHVALLFLELFAIKKPHIEAILEFHKISRTSIKRKENLRWYFQSYRNPKTVSNQELKDILQLEKNEQEKYLKAKVEENTSNEVDDEAKLNPIQIIVNRLEEQIPKSLIEIQQQLDLLFTITRTTGYFLDSVIQLIESRLIDFSESYPEDYLTFINELMNNHNVLSVKLKEILLISSQKISQKIPIDNNNIDIAIINLIKFNNCISLESQLTLIPDLLKYCTEKEVIEIIGAKVLDKITNKKELERAIQFFIKKIGSSHRYAIDTSLEILFDSHANFTNKFNKINDDNESKFNDVREFINFHYLTKYNSTIEASFYLDIVEGKEQVRSKKAIQYTQIVLKFTDNGYKKVLFENLDQIQKLIQNEFLFHQWFSDNNESKDTNCIILTMSYSNSGAIDRLFSLFRDIHSRNRTGTSIVYSNSNESGISFSVNQIVYIETVSYQKCHVDINYKISEDESILNKKLELNIELNTKPHTHQLAVLSDEILFIEINFDKKVDLNRAYIYYKLANMYNKDIWATTHYENNRFDIQILGFSSIEEIHLRETLSKDETNLYTWLDNSTRACFMRLCKYPDDTYRLKTDYKGGTNSVEIIKKSKIDKGATRYDFVEEKTYSEHFKVSSSGDLIYYSDNKIILKLKQYRFD